MIIFNPEKFTLTPSSGNASTTIITANSILMQLRVISTNADSTFDVLIQDDDGNELFNQENYTGICNELLNLPNYEKWTFKIENASKDVAHTCVLSFRRF